ncbi:hypothetical protein NEUTE2DRAFT_54418, partial [Neurospora tetrasperma FGSC 2509]
FLVSFKDKENLYFEFTSKATILFTDEDYVLFKTYSKKQARKVRWGGLLSVKIILTNEGIKEVLNELLTLLRYVYLFN